MSKIEKIICINDNIDFGITRGKEYNRFILSKDEFLLKDDFGELCVVKSDKFKKIIK